MSDVVVVQSFRESDAGDWIERCLASVRAWSQMQGYRYCFQGDSLFDPVPDALRRKFHGRTPIVADLARLLWIQDLLQRDAADTVVWLDADTLVFAGEGLTVRPQGPVCTFGREYWLTRDRSNRLRCHRNVHNAYCVFHRGCVVLPFLVDAVQRLLERVDERFAAPQFVGPKLVTALHNIVGFDLEPRAGAVSPDLAEALVSGDREVLGRISAELEQPVLAANLCRSLAADRDMHALIDALGELKSGLT